LDFVSSEGPPVTLLNFATKPQRIAHVRAEKEFHKLLIAEPLSAPVKVQAKEGPYSLDFFFPDWKLNIEIDGPWHDLVANEKRDGVLAKSGIVTLRLPADMPASQMRRHVVYISQRILLLPLADKITLLRSYKTELLDKFTAEPAPLGPQENCLDCSGSGWKLLPVWSEFLQHAEVRAARCECKNLRTQGSFTLASEDELTAAVRRKPPTQEPLFERTKTA
jgi:very-short-patch-repair endonuclease